MKFYLRLLRVILPLFFIVATFTICNAQYYNDVLSYEYRGAPDNGIMINTNMPFTNSTQMPTIIIEGYDYGTSTPIDLKIVYYIFNNRFIRQAVTSTTNWTPDIHLVNNEGEVGIYIDDKSNFVRFHIRVYANLREQAEWFEGWTHSDVAKPIGLPADQDVLVPYSTSTDAIGGVVEGGITQIFAPEGGSYVKNGIGNRGALKIKLPVLYTNTMLRLRVEVFHYLTDKSFTAIVGGYNYEPSSRWYNCSAQIVTSSLDNAHKVYFGDDGTNTIIWIGESDTEWNHIKVRISEVQVAHGNAGLDLWNNGWEVSLDESSFAGLVNRTVENTLPVSSGTSIWQTSNDNIYSNTSARVGIGTNAPTSELTVNGHIHTKEVRVYTAAGADFVFEDDYKLKDLKELERFVTSEKHLPDIPPAKEMIAEGIHLGDMDIKLLQKIEELTLYIIEMNKKIEVLETKNDDLVKMLKNNK